VCVCVRKLYLFCAYGIIKRGNGRRSQSIHHRRYALFYRGTTFCCRRRSVATAVIVFCFSTFCLSDTFATCGHRVVVFFFRRGEGGGGFFVRVHTHNIFLCGGRKKTVATGRRKQKKYLFQKKLNAYISQEKVKRGGFFWMKKTSNFLIMYVSVRYDR